MKSIILPVDDTGENLKLNFYETSHYKDILIIVGGSGDTKDSFHDFISVLSKKLFGFSYVTFSYRGVETNREFPLVQQVHDLEQVVEWIKKNHNLPLTLVCTSMGAFSTAHLLINNTYKEIIARTIFIDPADYSLDADDGDGTWSGFENYNPTNPTVSSLMKEIDSHVKVDVINFLLRNHGPHGYAPVEERGSDTPALFARLNNLMVKQFYDNTPLINRGEYIEDTQLPHAFMRDGDVKENIEHLHQLITSLLKYKKNQ
ncbi:hypothetical protein HGA88_04400 [Candidatus Roizmanbacteria bacterium]|nr:hypothetical protein [Candidatus Roizmanbacteria bacterium]